MLQNYLRLRGEYNAIFRDKGEDYCLDHCYFCNRRGGES